MGRFLAVGLLALVVGIAPTVADPIGYQAARPLDLGGDSEYATTADLTGDGVPDVVRTGADGGGLIVCVNRGDATFTTLPTVLPEYRSVRNPVVGDADGDGDLDVVAGLFRHTPGQTAIPDPEVYLLRNDGTGGLQPEVVVSPCDPWIPTSLIDLDADGDLDIAYGDAEYGPPHLMGTELNDGTGRFTAGPPIVLSEAEHDQIEDVAFFGELGADGLPTLLAELRVSGAVLLRPLGSATYSKAVEIPGVATEAVFADVTGDGHNDIVCAFGGAISVWTGTGDGWILKQDYYGRGGGRRDVVLCVADLDGDGDRDVAVGSYIGVVSVLRNPGDGSFETNHEYWLGDGTVWSPRYLGAGDFDGDGAVDLFVQSDTGVWLLSLGGAVPPTIEAIDPTDVAGGITQDFTITGARFTPETSFSLGEGNEVLDLRYVSDTELVATVDVIPYGKDDPSRSEPGGFDAIVTNPDGGSSRLPDGVRVEPWWDFSLRWPRASLKDSPGAGKDRLKFRGNIHFGPIDEVFARAGSDVRLVIGDAAAPVTIDIPGDDPGWRIRRDPKRGENIRMSWKSPRGAVPKIKLRLNKLAPVSKKFKLSVKNLEFPGPLPGPIHVEFHIGDIRGASIGNWQDYGKGRQRYPARD